MRLYLRRWLGIEALEKAVADKQTLIDKLTARLDAHHREMEAYRNLIAAKSEAEHDASKRVQASNLRNLRQLVPLGDINAD